MTTQERMTEIVRAARSLSLESRKSLMPFVKFAVKCSETARREGILALEDWWREEAPEKSFYSKEAFVLFRAGLVMVCDGYDGEIVRFVCEHIFESSVPDESTEEGLLTGLECSLAILTLQYVQVGEPHRVLFAALMSHFPIAEYEELYACLDGALGGGRGDRNDDYFYSLEFLPPAPPLTPEEEAKEKARLEKNTKELEEEFGENWVEILETDFSGRGKGEAKD